MEAIGAVRGRRFEALEKFGALLGGECRKTGNGLGGEDGAAPRREELCQNGGFLLRMKVKKLVWHGHDTQ